MNIGRFKAMHTLSSDFICLGQERLRENSSLNRAEFHNNLIRLKFNPIYVKQKYT